jgi:ParB/RepB/Spo0J family partition protein
MARLMSVDKLQEAEEHVAQMREQAARDARDARNADLRRQPVADTAGRPHSTITAPLAQVRTLVNMRTGPLSELHELAISIKETGLLHPPLVRATGDEQQPYELLAGQRRFGAMALLDDAEGAREDWRFTLVDGISRREALTMQFAENFHQSKPEPVQFARGVRLIMTEDPELTAAEVSRLVGAPVDWTRKALRLLELPEAIVERVQRGDLSFTAADLVRRGIARGDVTADRAEDLVEQLADGSISTTELKFGVGYVPSAPDTYDEWSRADGEARRTPTEPTGRADDAAAEQRDWESSSAPSASSSAPSASSAAPSAPPVVDPQGQARELRTAEVDAYLLGVFLHRAATDRQRAVLRITSEADAHSYAASLRPQERLAALRSLAAEMLEAAPGRRG